MTRAESDAMWAAIRVLVQRHKSRPIDWSPPKGERIGGVPPWQGGYRLERAA